MADDAKALAKAKAAAPNDFEVHWRLARHHFTKAARSKSDGVKEKQGQIAWQHADKAIAAKPKHAAGYYWATAAIGEYSAGAGMITAIRKGIEGKFKRYAKGAIRYGRRYEHGGGYRALGRFFFELPWPKRDVDKAIENLRKAVKFGPHKARNYAWLAEALIKDGKDKEARAVLTKCATVNPRREDAVDGRQFKKVCAKLLSGL